MPLSPTCTHLWLTEARSRLAARRTVGRQPAAPPHWLAAALLRRLLLRRVVLLGAARAQQLAAAAEGKQRIHKCLSKW